MMTKDSKKCIRNSTADFLVFTKDAHADGIEVRVQDGDVWLTQKAIGQLFDVDRSVVTKHLKAVYASGELSADATCANFAQVADNGKTYRYKFYSLAAIIAVGYRVNSARATQFRQWATRVLETFTAFCRTACTRATLTGWWRQGRKRRKKSCKPPVKPANQHTKER